MIQPWTLMFFAFALLVATNSKHSHAQVALRTRVVLDHETFSSANYTELQRVADQVAQTVDDLIPGRMSEFVYGDIVCYQVHEGDQEVQKGIHAPITLSMDYVSLHEPKAVIAGRTRIAVYGIEPMFEQRFVFQLAHELAHVKMGVRIDNYLVETFAVAVSHEVLTRMGFQEYMGGELSKMYLELPPRSSNRLSESRFDAVGRVLATSRFNRRNSY